MYTKDKVFDLLYLAVIEKKDLTSSIEEWSVECIQRNDFSFNSGLLGMGWLTTFLLHHHYIDAEDDDILCDVDDGIYKFTISTLQNNGGVQELLDLLSYHQIRYINASGILFYRKFVNVECVKLIVKSLVKVLSTSCLTSLSSVEDKIRILLRFSLLFRIGFDEKIFAKEFYECMESVFDFMSKKAVSNLNLLKLLFAAKQYKNVYWEKHLERELALRDDFDDNAMQWLHAMSYSSSISPSLYKSSPAILKLNIDKKTLYEFVANFSNLSFLGLK